MTDCSRTAEVLRALAANELGRNGPLTVHVTECTTCATAVVSRRLDQADEPDEDDIALYLAEMADEALTARVEDALARDRTLADRVAAVRRELDHPPARANPARRLAAAVAEFCAGQPSPRLAFGGIGLALLVAGGLLLTLGGPRERVPGERRGPLLMGADTEAEVGIGPDQEHVRICPAQTPAGGPRCAWRNNDEGLTLWYRSERGSRLSHLCAAIRDSSGAITRLFPEPAGAGLRSAPVVVTTGRLGGGCRGGFCVAAGGDYGVPAGPAEIRVLFSSRELSSAELTRTMWGDRLRSGRDADSQLYRFLLEVQP